MAAKDMVCMQNVSLQQHINYFLYYVEPIKLITVLTTNSVSRRRLGKTKTKTKKQTKSINNNRGCDHVSTRMASQLISLSLCVLQAGHASTVFEASHQVCAAILMSVEKLVWVVCVPEKQRRPYNFSAAHFSSTL